MQASFLSDMGLGFIRMTECSRWGVVQACYRLVSRRKYFAVVPECETYIELKTRLLYDKPRDVVNDFRGELVPVKVANRNKFLKETVDKFPKRVEGAAYKFYLEVAATLKNLTEGKRIHAHLLMGGRQREDFLGHHIVKMYLACRSLDDAKQLFFRLPRVEPLTWRLMYYTCAKLGDYTTVLRLHRCMRQEAILLEKRVILSTVFACANWGNLEFAREIHTDVVEAGLDRDLIVANAMVTMYGKCGRLDIARLVFETIEAPSVTSWNALMGCYVRHGYHDDALDVFYHLSVEGVELKTWSYACALSACASPAYLREGRYLHDCIELSGLEADVITGNALVNMYDRCGSLYHAQKVFDGVKDRNVITWTHMILAYVRRGLSEQAFRVYQAMQLEHVLPNKMTIIALLRACEGPELLEKGKLLHCQALAEGLEGDAMMAGAIVRMYSSCKSMADARRIFWKLHKGRTCVWNSILEAYLDSCLSKESLQLFRRMQLEGVKGDNESYAIVFEACENLGALSEARRIHTSLQGSSLELDVVLGGSALRCYGKCRSFEDLQRTFDRINKGKLASWNAAIYSHVLAGYYMEALEIFHKMMVEGAPPDAETFLALIPGLQGLEQRKFVHKCVLESGLDAVLDVGDALLDMCGKLKAVRLALRTFEAMPEVDATSWASIVSIYAQSGFKWEALQLFRDMLLSGVKPNELAFVATLKAVAELESQSAGEELHELVCQSGYGANARVASALIGMYAKCSSLEEARDLFDSTQLKDLECWKAIITACFEQEQYGPALHSYQEMPVKPDAATYATAIRAASRLGDFEEGQEIHAGIAAEDMNGQVAEALLDMYSEQGDAESCRRVFGTMTELPGVGSWNTLMSSYVRLNRGHEAVKLFYNMLQEGVQPDSSSLAYVLQASKQQGVQLVAFS